MALILSMLALARPEVRTLTIQSVQGWLFTRLHITEAEDEYKAVQEDEAITETKDEYKNLTGDGINTQHFIDEEEEEGPTE